MNNIEITKDCIQTINDFGKTTYVNICNGNINYVNWGTFDWAAVGLVMILAISTFILLFFMIWKVLSDY